MPETVFHTDSRPPTFTCPWTCKYLWRKWHCILILSPHALNRSTAPFLHKEATKRRSASACPPAEAQICQPTPALDHWPAVQEILAAGPRRRPSSSFLAPVASSHADHGGCADVACPPATTTSEPVLSTVLEHPRPTSRHRVKSCLSFFRFLFVYRSMRRNCFSD
jgi:hypothetical protein